MRERNTPKLVTISISSDERYPWLGFEVQEKEERYTHDDEPRSYDMVKVPFSKLNKLKRARGQAEAYQRMLTDLEKQAEYLSDPNKAPEAKPKRRIK